MSDARTDAEIVRATRAHPEEFDALYRRYVGRVYRYMRARGASDAVAEDITSDVFVDALAGLPAYREQGRFGAWLFTIARRHLADYWQARSRQSVVGEEPVDEPAHALADDLAALLGAMAHLTPERREALELRFFAGLSVRETAAVMDRGESAVKMLVHRGLEQLRRSLSEAGHG